MSFRVLACLRASFLAEVIAGCCVSRIFWGFVIDFGEFGLSFRTRVIGICSKTEQTERCFGFSSKCKYFVKSIGWTIY